MMTTDQYLLKLGKLADGNPGGPYVRRNGMIYFNNRVVIPPDSPLIQLLLKECHDTPMGGHSDILRTLKRVSQQFYWPAMHKSIKEYVAQCDVCQRVNSESLSPKGLLQPQPIPHQLWEDVSMDFVDGLPRSDNHTSIMVVVDRLSKAAHLVPLAHPYTAKLVAAKFIDAVVKHHGTPRSIVSDRDPIFVSTFWKELWRLNQTQLKRSSAYHPQTDGQTEVVNRCIEQYLRCFVHHRPNQWSYLLPWAEYWYNTTYHASTGMSPFKALYGREPPPLVGYEGNSTPVQELDALLVERDLVLKELKKNLAIASNRMKQVADSKRRDVNFQSGDWVYLRLQPYRQHTIFKRTSYKLSTRYYGPFEIESRIGLGSVAYRLKLPEGTRVHPVFHVSLLKKHIGKGTPTSRTLPPIRANGVLRLVPERVLKFRTIGSGESKLREALVQWTDLTRDDATWESVEQLRKSFPLLNLEDKILVRDGGNDASTVAREEEVQEEEEAIIEPNQRTSNQRKIPNRKYLNY